MKYLVVSHKYQKIAAEGDGVVVMLRLPGGEEDCDTGKDTKADTYYGEDGVAGLPLPRTPQKLVLAHNPYIQLIPKW